MNQTTYPVAPLLYAFADEVIEPDAWKSKGVKLPGQDKKVKVGPLAGHVFAFAFWRLAAEGVISLRHEERKRLGLITTKKVVATLLQQPVAPRVARTEQMLLEQIPAGEGRPVDDVIYRALGEDYAEPARVVVATAAKDGVTAGLFEEVPAERGAVGRLLKGNTDTVPVEAVMPAAKAQFAELLAQWNGFRAADPVLADQLVNKCDRGITRRTEADHDMD